MTKAPQRRYSRLDRVNQALREVIGDELERIGDERLGMATITGVHADPDFRRAEVWFDTLGPADEVAGGLAVHRVRFQAAIARQMHLKHTPELTFSPDPAIAVGTRVEEILRGLHADVEPSPPVGEDGNS